MKINMREWFPRTDIRQTLVIFSQIKVNNLLVKTLA